MEPVERTKEEQDAFMSMLLVLDDVEPEFEELLNCAFNGGVEIGHIKELMTKNESLAKIRDRVITLLKVRQKQLGYDVEYLEMQR